MENNRFDLLGAHHRTHSAASGLAAIIMVDAGVRDQVLAAGTDDRNLVLLAKFFLELLLYNECIFTPQVGGIAQFDLIVVNEKINGLRADAFQDDAVQPGITHLCRKVTSH